VNVYPPASVVDQVDRCCERVSSS